LRPFECASRDTFTWVTGKYDYVNPPALKRLIVAGALLRPFPQEVLEGCYVAANELHADLSKSNPHFNKLYAGLTVTIGGAGHDAFKQAEDAAHAVDPVERGDKMHLRRARVGKAHLDPAADQRAHQAFRAVHLVSPLGFFSVLQVSPMLIRLLSIDTIY
jgi:hypothetical protein